MRSATTPVTALFAAGLFFSGVTYASTLPYGAIVGIETLGIPNASYALLLMAGAIVSAIASVTLGFISDRIPDRRVLVIGCALMGAFAYGLIFFLRTPLAFIIAIAVIMPFGGALFSQSFSFARSFYNERLPERAEFMNSMLRTIFTIAWAIVPPIVGWIAAATGVFNVYGIAAAAYLVCAAIYTTMLMIPVARIGTPVKTATSDAAKPAAARVELPVLFGIGGVVLMMMAYYLNSVTTPLAIATTFRGTLADVGLYAGLAALLEVPFMIMWGYATRWLRKHTILVIAGVLYALYMILLSRVGSTVEVLWLQPLHGLAMSALMSIPISYMQDAIKGRVGLSTSLLDVVLVGANLGAAAIFAAVTASSANYPGVFLVAAALAGAGAVVLFTAHRVLRERAVPAA